MLETMDRQAFLLFPPLDRRDLTAQVRGNLLPRVQAVVPIGCRRGLRAEGIAGNHECNERILDPRPGTSKDRHLQRQRVGAVAAVVLSGPQSPAPPKCRSLWLFVR